jgi:serine/threonine protein kinase/predicted Zn-dependent protease
MSQSLIRSGEASLDLLIEEVAGKLQAREPVDAEAFIAAHPEHADRLRQLWPTLEALARLGPSLDPDGPITLETREPEHSTLGDFRIVRQIGRGGMGIVYEAEQMSLKRRVALKVLPFAGAMDARQLQRFKNESQAAAQLHHTNIVPVYYVGCERGVHFYAMQYIEGSSLAEGIAELRRQARPATPSPRARKPAPAPSPLVGEGGGGGETTPYTPPPQPSPIQGEGEQKPGDGDSVPTLDTKPIAARSTLHAMKDADYFRAVAQLGIQAAEALDHAHQHGIVHRDIKPANLMVDASGNLWITDFGLAQVQSETRLTLTGDLVGTLRYMSPEQALAKRVIVDHRTDVYSLGVTLYELLCLEPAYRGNDRQELLRQIAFEEPRRPRRLRKHVPAEMETIILKAMEKNPAERYATAKDLADDLRRFAMDEPIRARRPGVVQRVRKWGRRHQAVVTAALVFLVLAVVVLAGSTVWVWKAANAEKEAKETAQKRLEQIEKANDILGSIFNDLDPNEEEKGGPTLRVQLGERLDEAARLLEGEAIGDALVVARMQHVLGNSLHGLGYYDKAQPLLEKARHAIETVRGADHLNTLSIKNNLAALYLDQGKYDQAETLFREVLQGATAKLGGGHHYTLLTKRNLASLYKQQEKYDRAETLYKEGVQVSTAKLGVDHPDTLSFKLGLGTLYQEQGKHDQAQTLFKEVLQGWTAKLGADHPRTLTVKCNLASRCIALGEYDQAETLFKDLVVVCMAKLGGDHPSTLSNKNNLARVYHFQLKYDQAEKLWKEVLQGQTAKLGADHPDTLQSKYNLAVLYQDQRKYDEAETLFKEVLQAKITKLKADHPRTLGIKCNLAGVYEAQGKYQQAETLYKEALQGQTAKLGADHPDTLKTKGNLAILYHLQGDYDRVELLYKEVLQGMTAKLGAEHPDTLNSMYNLAVLYQVQGKYDQAETLCKQVLQGRTTKLGAEHPHTLSSLNQLAWQLATSPDAKHRDPKQAVELAKKATELAPRKGEYWGTLGAAHYRAGDFKASIEALNQAMHLPNGGGSDNWFFLAMAHGKLGDMEQARKWCDQAVAWMDKNQPKNAELRRFRAEAEEVLGIPEPPEPVPPPKKAVAQVDQ